MIAVYLVKYLAYVTHISVCSMIAYETRFHVVVFQFVVMSTCKRMLSDSSLFILAFASQSVEMYSCNLSFSASISFSSTSRIWNSLSGTCSTPWKYLHITVIIRHQFILWRISPMDFSFRYLLYTLLKYLHLTVISIQVVYPSR